jgi:hypothetical protein
MSEEKKTIAFYNRLKSGNTAEEWFEAIPERNRDIWAKVKAAFTVHWPKKMASLRSVHDKINLLKGYILKESELGVWKEEDGHDEQLHVLWVNKILTLANDVPDPAGLLIPEVRGLLLEVIRDHIESEFATWEDFANAIKAISKSSVDDALVKDKKFCIAMEESHAATAATRTILLQQSPTAPLHHML